MMIELFIFFELLCVVSFFVAFYTKQEIMWGVTAVMSGILMFTSFNIEYLVYVYDTSISAYAPTIIAQSFPYLMGINMLFFVLAMVLGLFDLFEKYGIKLLGRKDDD